ncbi:5'-methylthioadenosine/S-adenosylhomocysteine nucleosidase [Actinotalea sp. AC32]|nr:5'-methylthioadenosine/S-adenosylhomocysteine nucleosidase [Actinotalea sp. AC32]
MTVVVLVAMADEAAPFVDRADRVGSPVRVGRALHRDLVLDGRSVRLVETGIGLVNAAGALTGALLGERPEAVVSAGTAGGLAADVRVGDVVVGVRYRYWGADARAFGYELGQVPGMPAAYDGDTRLVEHATGADAGQVVRAGTMLSGDSFIHAGLVDEVRSTFPDALSTDMESTALAHTCFAHDVPFVSVRGVSDLCGPVAGEDFLTHVDDAAERSAAVVLAMLAR